MELTGNLSPILKSDQDPLYINFKPFTENRISCGVLVRDTNTDPRGILSFVHDPTSPEKVRQEMEPAICRLNILLPDFDHDMSQTSLHICPTETWCKSS